MIPIMVPDNRRHTVGLLLLAISWLLGTPVLALFTVINGFSIGEAEPSNMKLAKVFGVGMYVVGVGTLWSGCWPPWRAEGTWTPHCSRQPSP
jgi:hypothetical protein